MYRGHTVGVVIPAYNEEGFVGPTIESVPAFVDRIYVIDDGSTDGTWREIRDHARTMNETTESEVKRFTERVVPIQHAANRGVGGAIKTGYLRARDEGIDATAVMGGDGQMPPDVLERIFDPIVDDRADYVKGNRFLGATDRGEMPAFRFAGNALLGALTKIATGYWDNGDPQSGYTAISGRALAETDIEEMYEFYGYCNDLLAKLNVAGMRVLDVPSPITYGEEESDIHYRTYIPRVSWMLFRNFCWRLKMNYLLFDFHPLVITYVVGAVGILAGLAGVVWALPGVGTAGTSILRGALAIGTVLAGVLVLVAAMVLDRAANVDVSLVDRRTDVSVGKGTRTADEQAANADGRVETVRVAVPVDAIRELPAARVDGMADDEFVGHVEDEIEATNMGSEAGESRLDGRPEES